MKLVTNYPVYHRPTSVNKSKTQSAKPGAFLNQLRSELEQQNTGNGLKISKHAEQRMSERQIFISPEKWANIQQKVSEAKSKGVTDSLVLTDKAAMLVSATNNTVITVMNRDEAAKQIFTNINGTIIMN